MSQPNSDIVGLAERVERLNLAARGLFHARAMALQPTQPNEVETVQITATECGIIIRACDEGADTILSLKSEIEALREVMRDTARQLREFWAQDSGTSIHLVAADNLDRAALSGSPEG